MSSNDPNQNPYRPLSHPQKPVAPLKPATGRPIPRRARLGFFDCFFEAKTFLGPEYWLFWGLTFVGGLLGSLIPLILIGPMYCGIGFCFLAHEQGHRASFDLMFKGFDFFVNSLVPVLLYSLAMVIIIPCYMGGIFAGAMLISSEEEVKIVLGICSIIAGITILILGSTYISYGFIFSSFLVAEYKLEGMDAFNVSLSGVRKNFFGLFLVSIASAIMAICGMMLCYIPLLLMMPLYLGGPFICYRKIFRPELKGSGEF